MGKNETFYVFLYDDDSKHTEQSVRYVMIRESQIEPAKCKKKVAVFAAQR